MSTRPKSEEVSALIAEMWDWRGYWVVCSPRPESQFSLGLPVLSLCGATIPFDEELATSQATDASDWDQQADKIAELRPDWPKVQRSESCGPAATFWRARKLSDCSDWVREQYESYTNEVPTV